MRAKKSLTQAPGIWYFKIVKSLRTIARGLFIAAALLLAAPGHSGAGSKYAGEFLSLGVGARPMGMGGAYAAISDDASAVYWNPAGLVNSSSRQLLVMHAESFGGLVRQDYLGLVLPLRTSQNALGFGLLRLGVEDIPYTEWDPETQRPRVLKEVNDAEYVAYFSYARRGGGSWSLGGSAKLIRKVLGDDDALGLGLDAGLQYRPRPNLFLGAMLADMTSTPLVWNSGHKDYILPMLKLATAYGLTFKPLRGELLLALDIETRFEGRDYAAWASVGGVSFDPRMGLEYWYRHRVAMRAGIQPQQFSAGASIRVGMWGLDYAFLGHEDLDNSHRLSALAEF
jgi:hypothetical protein